MVNLSDIKGIIFDYGGTIDSHGDHWSEVIYDGYNAAGVILDKNVFRDAYVYAERFLAVNREIIPTDNFKTLMQKKIRIEVEYLLNNDLYPDGVHPLKAIEAIAEYCYQSAKKCVTEASETLAALAEKYPMVLVSNFYGNVEEVLRDFDIRKYFNGIIESAVVGVRKPDPRIFMLGVVALGLKPEEVLVVGDSLRKDILPARSIGCKTAWIKGKGWTPEEDAAQDAAQIPDLKFLLSLS
ncbi:MAG: HAD family hydrolase [Muribaculaceae bacterium]